MTPNIIQQSDRDAAAALFVTSRAKAACVRGEYDGSDFVQAFASYRLQVMEEAAKIVDELAEIGRQAGGVVDDSYVRRIAQRVRHAPNYFRTNHRANEGGGDE